MSGGRLTAEEIARLICDCGRDGGDPHGTSCATRGEFDVLMGTDLLVERVEAIVQRQIAGALNEAADAIDPNSACRCESCLAETDAARTIRKLATT